MTTNTDTRPRRRSMTDAFTFLRNPGAADAARDDFINMVEGMRQRNSQADEFANTLPKLNEKDLESLGHSDSTCPICLTSLLAILAEEEMAVAMDSPAHPLEELGVTRLVQTCGHIFCRKDIRGWLYQGHTTCPSCRTPFIVPHAVEPATGQIPDFPIAADASFDAFLDTQVTRAFEAFLRAPAPAGQSRSSEHDGQPGSLEDLLPEAHFEYSHDRDEFSGMYS